MANEIHFDYESGESLYFVRRDSGGKVALSDGSSFEDWGDGGHSADDYDVALAENGVAGGHYIGDFDLGGNIAAGHYTIQVFLQASGSPSEVDELVGSGLIVWSGRGEWTVEKMFANKAIQSKIDGSIDYYDDDGQTIILTQTPTEDESEVTRMPS